MKRKTFSEADILEIDDCAPSMTDMPGVLQVFAGYGRSMNRLPAISQDGSLIVLMDVADTFVRRCFDIFDVRKFPCEYASTVPPPDKVETVSKSVGRSLSKRSVMRFKISKVGSFLSSGYRVVLQMTVGGSIFNFAEYDVASPPEIFAAMKTALRG
jgi:hypothetical protein